MPMFSPASQLTTGQERIPALTLRAPIAPAVATTIGPVIPARVILPSAQQSLPSVQQPTQTIVAPIAPTVIPIVPRGDGGGGARPEPSVPAPVLPPAPIVATLAPIVNPIIQPAPVLPPLPSPQPLPLPEPQMNLPVRPAAIMQLPGGGTAISPAAVVTPITAEPPRFDVGSTRIQSIIDARSQQPVAVVAPPQAQPAQPESYPDQYGPPGIYPPDMMIDDHGFPISAPPGAAPLPSFWQRHRTAILMVGGAATAIGVGAVILRK